MIIPSTILLQANLDAPNSSKRGRIVEELWKNCSRILQARADSGRRGKIVEELKKYFWTSARKIFLQFFHNSSPPGCLKREGRQIFLQFFHNSSP
jgi:hypothetical protein